MTTPATYSMYDRETGQLVAFVPEGLTLSVVEILTEAVKTELKRAQWALLKEGLPQGKVDELVYGTLDKIVQGDL